MYITVRWNLLECWMWIARDATQFQGGSVAKSGTVDDMDTQHKSITEVIEMQADLSETYDIKHMIYVKHGNRYNPLTQGMSAASWPMHGTAEIIWSSTRAKPTQTGEKVHLDPIPYGWVHLHNIIYALRLEQRLRRQRAKLSKAMKQVNNSTNSEAKLRAVSYQLCQCRVWLHYRLYLAPLTSIIHTCRHFSTGRRRESFLSLIKRQWKSLNS